MADSFEELFPSKGGTEKATEIVTEPTEVQPETVEETGQEEPKEETVAPVTPEPVSPVVEAPRGEPRAPHHVPLDVLLEERQKKQEAERQRQEALAELERLKAAQSAQNIPDPFDNPDEFRAALLQQAKEQALAEFRQQQAAHEQAQLRANWDKAASQHPQEETNAALEFAHRMTLQNTPEQQAWAKNIFSHPDPVAAILEQKNRHVQFEEYTRDPEGFLARKAAEMGIAAPVDAVAANSTNTAAKAAPKGINSVGLNNKSNEPTKGDAFDRLFGK